MILQVGIGDRIKLKRKALTPPLTADALAKRAGINRTYISKIEHNVAMPHIGVMIRIAEILDDSELFRCYLFKQYPSIVGLLKLKD